MTMGEAVPPGWYPETQTGALRWWDGEHWTEWRHPPQTTQSWPPPIPDSAAQPLHGAPPPLNPAKRTSGGRLWILAVIVVVAILLVGGGVIAYNVGVQVASVTRRLADDQLAIRGAPGYTTTVGESGRPLAEGSPWALPCQPIVIQVNPRIPAQQYVLMRQAIEGARALGVDVTVETQYLVWYPSLLYPAGQTNASVKFVPIVASTATPPNLPDGHAERIGIGWDTKVSSDGNHDVLTDLQATIYLRAVQGDPEETERATRELVAFSQGVADSTSPGSSIATGNTEEGYSRRDVAAMQRMSGCTFQPTTHPGLPEL